MPERKPYLSAAFFCERVMEEKDGVLSAIRLVDTFTAHTNLPAGTVPVVELTLVVSFKSDSPTPDKHEIGLRITSPSGKELAGTGIPPHMMITLHEEAGANVILRMRLAMNEAGRYWADVLVDGEVITKAPFKLLREETPASRLN